jgi:hypothetical protein
VSKLSERQRLVLTISVSVLLTGVLLFLVFSDRSEIQACEEEIDALDARLQAAEIERRKIPGREKEVLIFRAVEASELAVLPSQQRIADFHRNLSTFLSAADMRFQELPESEEEDSDLAKGIRVTRNKLKGRGDSTSILKFVNMIENDPRLVAVKGLKISAGDLDRDDPGAPVLHDVEIALETYYYRPSKAGIRREHIPGAERRLQDPELRAAIAAFQPERPDTYVLRPAVGRRDPLVDPRRSREKVDPEERERQWQREETVVIDLETRYRAIAEKMEQEKALGVHGDLFRQDRLARQVNAEINELRTRLEHTLHTKAVQLPELQARVEIVVENLNRARGRRVEKDLVVTRPVAAGVLKELKEHFENGEYEALANLGTGWTSFLRGKQVTPEAQPVIAEIRALREKATILGEFEAMVWNISGLIVNKERPERSLAVINGARVRMGDRMDADGEVTVESISTGYVEFSYKGETIQVALTGRGADAKRAPKAD